MFVHFLKSALDFCALFKKKCLVEYDFRSDSFFGTYGSQ